MHRTSPCPRAQPAARWRRHAGFTMIELLMVITLVAVSAGLVSLALRDGAANRLEQDGARLAALLESARAEARASGLLVRWVPTPNAEAGQFRFIGLPASLRMPVRWLDANTYADTPAGGSLVLGPEPMIGAQQVVLHLGAERLVLTTDGLGPWQIAAPARVP